VVKWPAADSNLGEDVECWSWMRASLAMQSRASIRLQRHDAQRDFAVSRQELRQWGRRERGPHFWREFDPHWERVFGWERMVSPLGAGGLIAAECVEVRDVAVLGLSGVTWGRAVGWRGG